MPSIDSIDILENSFLLKSAQDRQQDRAMRGAAVAGLDEGTSYAAQMHEAATYLLGNLDPHYPGDASLPLLGVRPRAIGNGQALVDVVYGHSRDTNPTQSPWDMASIDYYGETKAAAAIRVYRDGSGELQREVIDTPGLYEWKRQEDYEAPTAPDEAIQVHISAEKVPIFLISVPTGRLTTNPLAAMEDLIGHHNSDSVTIASKSFDAGQLRCVGWRARAIDAAGTVVRPGDYRYFYRPHPFTNISFELGGGTGQTIYLVEITTASPSAAFGGAFPTFEGLGP